MHGNRGVVPSVIEIQRFVALCGVFCSGSRNAFVRVDLIHKFAYQARRIALFQMWLSRTRIFISTTGEVRPPGTPTTPGMPGGGGPPAERRDVLGAPFA